MLETSIMLHLKPMQKIVAVTGASGHIGNGVMDRKD
jgi:NADP-dependent 3-hydroxy acid dehydrogenase YdfG